MPRVPQYKTLIAGLYKIGHTIAPEHRQSVHYMVFEDIFNKGWYYYVGKGAALRYGRTQKLSKPVGCNARELIMRAALVQLAKH